MTLKENLRTLLIAAAVAGALAGCGDAPAIVIEPLRIVNVAPAHGSLCVDPDVRVFVSFSDDIDVQSLRSGMSLRDASGTVEGTVGYDKQTFTATFTPSSSLDFDRLYTLVLGGGIRGVSQGELGAEVQISFRTVARQGCTPGVECQLPSDCPEPSTQICSNIGVCIDECVTDADCVTGTCTNGDCT